jgi:hypothetical protein
MSVIKIQGLELTQISQGFLKSFTIPVIASGTEAIFVTVQGVLE